MPNPTPRQIAAILKVSDWPKRLSLESDDILLGNAILERIEPFLQHLVERGLAITTLRRHHNNLFLLTNEAVRCVHATGDYLNIDVDEILEGLLSEREGPMLRHADEAEQKAVDTTCGLFYRFRIATKKSSGTKNGSTE